MNNDGAKDSIIHFYAENSVTVLGVTGLTSEDIVAVPGTSYVLFSRTSTGGGHRDDWVGSEANSQPSTTPGSNVPASSFDADTATGPGTALADAAAADYLTDGTLQNVNLAMFNLTESSPGTFATGAPAISTQGSRQGPRSSVPRRLTSTLRNRTSTSRRASSTWRRPTRTGTGSRTLRSVSTPQRRSATSALRTSSTRASSLAPRRPIPPIRRARCSMSRS